ncbi:MAG: hypothetical protein PHC43_09595 [Candidatus Marinimicrobia bacterium]|nr:hypothetical protein [Candidatus Neomarinimicrobiota bacterium]
MPDQPGAKARSLAKLKTKDMNFVVWNDPGANGVGFAHDTNAVTLLARDGGEWNFPLASKRAIADQILTTVIKNYIKNK